MKIVGILARRDALIAYNKALNDDASQFTKESVSIFIKYVFDF